MEEPPHHHIVDGVNDPQANYSAMSLFAHLLAASSMIALFFTRDEALAPIHNSLILLLAIPLIAFVTYRFLAGFPRPADQHPFFNFFSRLVLICLLIAVFVISLSGLLLPLFSGESYQFFSFASWEAPYAGNRLVYVLLLELHDATWSLILPLVALYILSLTKQFFAIKRGSRMRRLMPIRSGK